MEFKISSKYAPAGDQPKAIDALVKGVKAGKDSRPFWGLLEVERLLQRQT